MTVRTGQTATLLLSMVLCTLCFSCANPGGGGPGRTAGPDRAPLALKEGGGDAASAAELPLGPAARPAEWLSEEPVRLPEELTRQECFFLALQQNKDIRVARLGARVAETRVEGAKGEFDTNAFMEAARGRSNRPVAGVPLGRTDLSEGAFSAGVRKRIVTGTDVELTASSDYSRDIDDGAFPNPSHGPEVTLGLSQDLLRNFGVDVNRTNIVIARNNWKISEEELRDTVMQRLFQVEQTYWQLYFAKADVKIRQKQVERAHELVERARKQAAVGRSAALDEARAKTRAAVQATAILEAQNTITRLTHWLLRVLGILDVERAESDFELADTPVMEPLETSLSEAVRVAQQARPDYRQAELAVENAELEQRFRRNQRLPTLQLFGEYGFAGLDDSFGDSVDVLDDGDFGSWQVGLRFAMPILNRRARSDYRAAQLDRRRAKVRLDDLRERITLEIAGALADLETAEGRISTTREARQLAELLLQKEEISFSLGRSYSSDVLDAQDALGGAERDEVRARTDHATALANLFRAQGTLLQEKGIAFARRGNR